MFRTSAVTLAVLPAAFLAACGTSTTQQPAGTATSPVSKAILSSVPEPSVAPVPGAEPVKCDSGSYAIRVVRSGSVASQPFEVIGLRNTGTSTTTLAGYPDVIAYRGDDTPPVSLTVHHGGIYEWPDATSRPVHVDPGKELWFAMGYGTATQHIVSLRTLLIHVPHTNVRCTLSTSFGASATSLAAPYEMTVTALQAPTR